jgi:hypothetical protein
VSKRPEELDAIGERVRGVKYDDRGLDEPITPESVKQLVEDRRRLWIEMMFLESLVEDEFGDSFRSQFKWVGDEKDGYAATVSDE